MPILLSYGATEFGGPVSRMTLELHATWGRKIWQCGARPARGAAARGRRGHCAVLPPGQEGILEVISPRIGPDWIRTSDIAVIDEDGFLFHRGRADGAIIRGGFKLLPETIEQPCCCTLPSPRPPWSALRTSGWAKYRPLPLS